MSKQIKSISWQPLWGKSINQVSVNQPEKSANFSQFLSLNKTQFCLRFWSSTVIQKLSKCEVKVWLCWNLIILPPLRIYVKSNLGKFKHPKMPFLAILEVLKFDLSKSEQLSSPKFTKNSKFRVSEIAKLTFLDRLILPKFDFT